jgi:hypothetical protein
MWFQFAPCVKVVSSSEKDEMVCMRCTITKPRNNREENGVRKMIHPYCFIALTFVWRPAVFAEETLYETDALIPHAIIRPVPPYLQDSARKFQAAPSITISHNGRLWVSLFTGGNTEGIDNAIVVISSGDGGKTWSKPLFALDIKGPLRFLDPGFWTDPAGQIWLFYGQLYGFWDGRGGLWAIHPENPDDENTRWSGPRRLCDGYLKNKPLVTSAGRWVVPVEFLFCPPAVAFCGAPVAERDKKFIFSMSELNGANVFTSEDKGSSFTFCSQAHVPQKDRSCYEHMIVEKRDGAFWMLIRTNYGIGESFSYDRGRTWTEVKPSKIQNPSSRFFFGRLKSGKLLLVKNGPVDKRYTRSHITAFLSSDEGRSWEGGLVLDERERVSYPDVVQDQSGIIYVVHDRERTVGEGGAREIVFHRITEDDIGAGKLVSPESALKIVANKATGK